MAIGFLFICICERKNKSKLKQNMYEFEVGERKKKWNLKTQIKTGGAIGDSFKQMEHLERWKRHWFLCFVIKMDTCRDLFLFFIICVVTSAFQSLLWILLSFKIFIDEFDDCEMSFWIPKHFEDENKNIYFQYSKTWNIFMNFQISMWWSLSESLEYLWYQMYKWLFFASMTFFIWKHKEK